MKSRFALLAVLLACSCTFASAGGLSTRLSQVEASRFPTISVLLGVFSEVGHPVPGLTRDDFTVDEEGTPVSVLGVDVEKAPLSLAIVLDVSGSMKPSMDQLKLAVSDFIRNLEPHDRATLLTFSDKVRVREELTAARAPLLDAVGTLEPEGATALYDAMHDAVGALQRVEGRRLAVVFTDGKDQNAAGTGPQSVDTPKGVAKMARNRQVPLWTIALGKDVDTTLLEKLAAATGGRSYKATDAGELRRAFGDVLTDVRLQYRLTYRSPRDRTDGTLRTIQVTSTAKGQKDQGRIRYRAPAATPAPEPAIPAKVADGPTASSSVQPRPAGDVAAGAAGPGTSVRVNSNVQVQGAGSTVGLGGGHLRINGPSGNVNLGPGGIHVGSGGAGVKVGPGVLDLQGDSGAIKLGPGGIDLQGDTGSLKLGPGGLEAVGGGDSVRIGPDGTIRANDADGDSAVVGPDGSIRATESDGDEVQIKPGGSDDPEDGSSDDAGDLGDLE